MKAPAVAPPQNLVDGVDVDAVAQAVRGCAGVEDLYGGFPDEVATYLPGRRIFGVRVNSRAVEVQVRTAWGLPVWQIAVGIQAAVAPLAGGRAVDVTVAELGDPPSTGQISAAAQPGTSGQAGATAQDTAAERAEAAAQPGTSGQAGATAQDTAAERAEAAAQPGTSGQAGATAQDTAAERAEAAGQMKAAGETITRGQAVAKPTGPTPAGEAQGDPPLADALRDRPDRTADRPERDRPRQMDLPAPPGRPARADHPMRKGSDRS